MNLGSNGHLRPNYPNAYFGHPNQSFSKLTLLTSLHILQDHIMEITMELANLAETFPVAWNKNPKQQSLNKNKITSILEIHKTNFTVSIVFAVFAK